MEKRDSFIAFIFLACALLLTSQLKAENEKFIQAIKNHNFSKVKALLNKENINQKNKSGMTPLIVALMSKDKRIILYLINQGADLNQKSSTWKRAVFYAADLGDVQIMKRMVKKGVNLKSVSYYNKSPVIFFASNLKMLQYLLSKGVKLHKTNFKGYNIIQYQAISLGILYFLSLHKRVLKKFYKKNLERLKALKEVLLFAAKNKVDPRVKTNCFNIVAYGIKVYRHTDIKEIMKKSYQGIFNIIKRRYKNIKLKREEFRKESNFFYNELVKVYRAANR